VIITVAGSQRFLTERIPMETIEKAFKSSKFKLSQLLIMGNLKSSKDIAEYAARRGINYLRLYPRWRSTSHNYFDTSAGYKRDVLMLEHSDCLLYFVHNKVMNPIKLGGLARSLGVKTFIHLV